jgi:ribosomal protein S18 acetylase RimI-like enzyme
MTVVLNAIVTKETEKLIPILLDAEEGEERIRTAMADEKNTNYAALEGEELVGAATVKWEEQESEILYIAVIQKCRGRGYGKTIIEGLKTEMRRRGVHSLVVGTANSSIENIAFYQKCGFRMYQVRRDFFHYIQPPVKENDILMCDMLVLRYES